MRVPNARELYRSLFTHRRNDSNDCKVQTDLSGDEFDDSVYSRRQFELGHRRRQEARQQLIIRGIIPVLSDGRETVSKIISNDNSNASDVFLDALRRNPSGAADVEAMAIGQLV